MMNSEPRLVKMDKTHVDVALKCVKNMNTSTYSGIKELVEKNRFDLASIEETLENSILNLSQYDSGVYSEYDLCYLYKNKFSKVGQKAYSYYKKIISRASVCGYCGIVENSLELDHFLPKFKYKELAIVPINLVPSCSLCNKKLKERKVPNDSEGLLSYFVNPYFYKFNSSQCFSIDETQTDYHQMLKIVKPTHPTIKYHFKYLKLPERYTILYFKKIDILKSQMETCIDRLVTEGYSMSEIKEMKIIKDTCVDRLKTDIRISRLQQKWAEQNILEFIEKNFDGIHNSLKDYIFNGAN